ncbi:ATP-dependent DNA ligase [Alishewanella longhuensis]
MLHHQDARYKTGRSADLLKLKSYQDTEAIVIGYRPGKGKYQGRVGALIVRTPEGKEFAIGSGLTDVLRQTPPEIGTVITYRYNGYTNNGIPRFARFLRVRETF